MLSLIEKKNYRVINIDSTVVLENPKLNPFISEMQVVIASILKIDVDAVSIKATTHEQVDSFGEGKAIKAYAVCLLNKSIEISQ